MLKMCADIAGMVWWEYQLAECPLCHIFKEGIIPADNGNPHTGHWTLIFIFSPCLASLLAYLHVDSRYLRLLLICVTCLRKKKKNIKEQRRPLNTAAVLLEKFFESVDVQVILF